MESVYIWLVNSKAIEVTLPDPVSPHNFAVGKIAVEITVAGKTTGKYASAWLWPFNQDSIISTCSQWTYQDCFQAEKSFQPGYEAMYLPFYDCNDQEAHIQNCFIFHAQKIDAEQKNCNIL